MKRVKSSRSDRIGSDLKEINIFVGLTLIIFFVAIGFPTLINTSPSLGYEGINFTPVTSFYQEAYAEMELRETMFWYSYNPLLFDSYTYKWLISLAPPEFPPDDPFTRYLETEIKIGTGLVKQLLTLPSIPEAYATHDMSGNRTYPDPYMYHDFDVSSINPDGKTYQNLGKAGSIADAFSEKFIDNLTPETSINITISINNRNLFSRGLLAEGAFMNSSELELGNTETAISFGTEANKGQWKFIEENNNGTGLFRGSNLTSINYWVVGDLTGSDTADLMVSTDAPFVNNLFTVFTSTGSNKPLLQLRNDEVSDVKWTLVAGDGQSVIPVEDPDTGDWHMITILINKTGAGDGTFCVDTVCFNEAFDNAYDSTIDPTINQPLHLSMPTRHATGGVPSLIRAQEYYVDEFAVWDDHILNTTEISFLYNSGNGSRVLAEFGNATFGFSVLNFTLGDSGGVSDLTPVTDGGDSIQKEEPDVWQVREHKSNATGSTSLDVGIGSMFGGLGLFHNTTVGDTGTVWLFKEFPDTFLDNFEFIEPDGKPLTVEIEAPVGSSGTFLSSVHFYDCALSAFDLDDFGTGDGLPSCTDAPPVSGDGKLNDPPTNSTFPFGLTTITDQIFTDQITPHASPVVTVLISLVDASTSADFETEIASIKIGDNSTGGRIWEFLPPLQINYTNTGGEADGGLIRASNVIEQGRSYPKPYIYVNFDNSTVLGDGSSFKNLGKAGEIANGFMAIALDSSIPPIFSNITASVADGTLSNAGLINQAVIVNGSDTSASIDQTWVQFGTQANQAQYQFLNENNNDGVTLGSNNTAVNFWYFGDITNGGDTWTWILGTNCGNSGVANMNIWRTVSSNLLRVNVVNDDGSGTFKYSDAGSTLPTTAQWHMITVNLVKSNTITSQLEVFIDGVSQGSTTQLQTWDNTIDTATANPLILGGTPRHSDPFSSSCEGLNGDELFDELAVWDDTVLTQQQVDFLFNNGTGSTVLVNATQIEIQQISSDVAVAVDTVTVQVRDARSYPDPYLYINFDNESVKSNGTVNSLFTNLGTAGTIADGIMAKGLDSSIPPNFDNVTISQLAGTQDPSGIIGEAVILNGTQNGAIDNLWVQFGIDTNDEQWLFLQENNDDGVTLGSNLTSVNFWHKGDLSGLFTWSWVAGTGCGQDLTGGYNIWTTSVSTTIRNSISNNEVTDFKHSVTDGTFANDANWHMTTFVLNKTDATNNNGLKIYVDGVLNSEFNATNAWDSTIDPVGKNPFILGGTERHSDPFNSSCSAFAGDTSFDELSIWDNYNLNATEIRFLWSGGNGSVVLLNAIDANQTDTVNVSDQVNTIHLAEENDEVWILREHTNLGSGNTQWDFLPADDVPTYSVPLTPENNALAIDSGSFPVTQQGTAFLYKSFDANFLTGKNVTIDWEGVKTLAGGGSQTMRIEDLYDCALDPRSFSGSDWQDFGDADPKPSCVSPPVNGDGRLTSCTGQCLIVDVGDTGRRLDEISMSDLGISGATNSTLSLMIRVSDTTNTRNSAYAIYAINITDSVTDANVAFWNFTDGTILYQENESFRLLGLAGNDVTRGGDFGLVNSTFTGSLLAGQTFNVTITDTATASDQTVTNLPFVPIDNLEVYWKFDHITPTFESEFIDTSEWEIDGTEFTIDNSTTSGHLQAERRNTQDGIHGVGHKFSANVSDTSWVLRFDIQNLECPTAPSSIDITTWIGISNTNQSVNDSPVSDAIGITLDCRVGGGGDSRIRTAFSNEQPKLANVLQLANNFGFGDIYFEIIRNSATSVTWNFYRDSGYTDLFVTTTRTISSAIDVMDNFNFNSDNIGIPSTGVFNWKIDKVKFWNATTDIHSALHTEDFVTIDDGDSVSVTNVNKSAIGILGNAFLTNTTGNNQEVVIGGTASDWDFFIDSTNNSTINLWINDNGCTTNTNWIIETRQNSPQGEGVDFIVDECAFGNNNLLINYIGDTGSVFAETPDGTYAGNQNTWDMYTVVHDNTNDLIHWYKNGIFIQTDIDSTVLSGTSDHSPTLFNAGFVSNQPYLNTAFDEWSIWSRTLNSTEISDLYNAGYGLMLNNFAQQQQLPAINVTITDTVTASDQTATNLPFVPIDNLEVYWKFDHITPTYESEFIDTSEWQQTGTHMNIDNSTTSGQLEIRLLNDQSGIHGISHQLSGNASDTEFVLRFPIEKMNGADDMQDVTIFTVYGISSTDHSTSIREFISPLADSIGVRLFYQVDETTRLQTVWSDDERAISNNVDIATNFGFRDIYVEIIRNSATSVTWNFYNDTGYTELWKTTTRTILAGVDQMDFIRFGNDEIGANGVGFFDHDINNVKFWNATTDIHSALHTEDFVNIDDADSTSIVNINQSAIGILGFGFKTNATGSAQQVTIGGTASDWDFLISTSNTTHNFWIKDEGCTGASAFIFDTRTAGDGNLVSVEDCGFASKKLRVNYIGSAGSITEDSPSGSYGTNDARFDMYTIVHDNTNDEVLWYKNGTLILTSPTVATVLAGTSNNAPNIFSSQGVNFNNATGDEWSVWSRALNSSEISDLYNAGDGLMLNNFAQQQQLPAINVTITDTATASDEVAILFTAQVTLPTNGSDTKLELYYKFNATAPMINEPISRIATYLKNNGTTSSQSGVGVGTGLFGETNGAHTYGEPDGNERSNLVQTEQFEFLNVTGADRGITLNVWARGTGDCGAGDTCSFLDTSTSGFNNGIFFGISNVGFAGMRFAVDGVFQNIGAGFLSTDNTYHMYTFRMNDTGQMEAYKDAVFQGSVTVSAGNRNFLPVVNQITIGGENSFGTQNFEQFMDEMSLWSTALSQEQLDLLYNNGSGFNITGTAPDTFLIEESDTVTVTDPAPIIIEGDVSLPVIGDDLRLEWYFKGEQVAPVINENATLVGFRESESENSVTLGTGIIGSSLNFDGAGDNSFFNTTIANYQRFIDSLNNTVGEGQTFNYWLKSPDRNRAQYFIVTYQHAVSLNEGCWVRGASNNNDFFQISCDQSALGDAGDVLNFGVLFDNAYHMYTVAIDPTNQFTQFYRDSLLIANFTGTTWNNSTITHGDLTIGANQDVAQNLSAGGDLDEISIWSTELDTDQIKFLYRGGNGTEIIVPSIDTTDLEAYWKFEETSGNMTTEAFVNIPDANSVLDVGISKTETGIIGNAWRSSETGSTTRVNIGGDGADWAFQMNGNASYNFWITQADPVSAQDIGFLWGDATVPNIDQLGFIFPEGQANYQLLENGVNKVQEDSGAGYLTTACRPNCTSFSMYTMTKNVASSEWIWYLNGTIHATDSPVIAGTTGMGSPMNLFARSTDGFNLNGATLDEMSVWSRVLTPDEVTILFNNGSGFELTGVAPPAPPLFNATAQDTATVLDQVNATKIGQLFNVTVSDFAVVVDQVQNNGTQPLPANVTNFTIANDNVNREIDLSWDASLNADSYRIERLSTEREITHFNAQVTDDNLSQSMAQQDDHIGDNVGSLEGEIPTRVSTGLFRRASSVGGELERGAWFNILVASTKEIPDIKAEYSHGSQMIASGLGSGERPERACVGDVATFRQDGMTPLTSGAYFDGLCRDQAVFRGNQLHNLTSADVVNSVVFGSSWLNNGSANNLADGFPASNIRSDSRSGSTHFSWTGTQWTTTSGFLELRVWVLNQTAVELITLQGNGNTTFTDSSVLEEEGYFYRIIPISAGQDGNATVYLNQTLSVLPDHVPDLNGTDNITSVDLDWAEAQIVPSRTGSEDPIQGYIVQRATGGNETQIHDGHDRDFISTSTHPDRSAGGVWTGGFSEGYGQQLNITQAQNITRFVALISHTGDATGNVEPTIQGAIWNASDGGTLALSMHPHISWNDDRIVSSQGRYVNVIFDPPIQLPIGEYVFGFIHNGLTCSGSCGGNPLLTGFANQELMPRYNNTNNGDADGFAVVALGGNFPDDPINGTNADLPISIYAEADWQTIGQTDEFTFTFTDNSPPNGTIAYRVLPFNDAGIADPPVIAHDPKKESIFNATNAEEVQGFSYSNSAQIPPFSEGKLGKLNIGEIFTLEVIVGVFEASATDTVIVLDAETVTFNPIPEEINDLIAFAVGDSCELTWSTPINLGDPLAPINGYKIVRSIGGASFFTLVANTSSTLTAFNDTGLVAQANHNYDVRALNKHGEALSSNIAVCLPQPTNPPNSPTILTATNVGENVQLDWTASTEGNPTGYFIERKIDGGAWADLVLNTGTPATVFIDQTVAVGTKYFYRVSAINAFGISAPSNEATVTTLNPPSMPTLFAVQNVNQIDLTWTEPTNNGLNGYQIDRRINFGAFSVLIANTSSTDLNFTDTDVTAGTTFGYRVRGLDQIGAGLVSNVVDVNFGSKVIVEVREQDGTSFKGGGTVKIFNTTSAIGGVLFNTTGVTPDGAPFGVDLEADGGLVGQLLTLSSQQVESVQVLNINAGGNEFGTMDAVIYSGVSNNTSIASTTLEATSDSIDLNDFAFDSDIDITFNFTGAPTLTGSDIVIAIRTVGLDDQVFLKAVNATNEISGLEGRSIADKSDGGVWLLDPFIDAQPQGYDSRDILMAVTIAGSGGGVDFEQSEVINAQSNAVFSNIAVGNYNFTFIDLDGFILNKTINFPFPPANLTSSFEIRALVFDVDCPSNGFGSDVRIKVNYTDLHDITEFPSAPVCDSSDKVSWSTTWGGSEFSADSTMIADFISVNFKNNAEEFLVSTVPTATSFSAPDNRITSDMYPIVPQIPQTSQTINFDLFLGKTPPSGGGGGGSPSPFIPSITPRPEDLQLTGLSLLSRTHQFAQAGDIIRGFIDIQWEGEEPLTITRITIGDFRGTMVFLDSPRFDIPQSIEGSGEFAMSSGSVPYVITLAPQVCQPEIGLDQNCLIQELFAIPVEFEFEFKGQVVTGSTNVMVDASPVPFDIVQLQVILLGVLLIGSALAGNFIRQRLKKQRKPASQKRRKFKKKFDSS